MFGDWIRRFGFWTLDFFKGSPIRNNYIDIRKRMESGLLNKYQLQKLLDHAVHTTEFYKNFNPNDITSFPIISKINLKESWDLFFSSLYRNKKTHPMSTSGSTGTPFTMQWDMGKRKHHLAEVIYFNNLAEMTFGKRYAYFRVWIDMYSKSKLGQWIQNLVPIDIVHLDDEKLEYIRQRLKNKPYINSCLGYASTFEFLEKYVSLRGDAPNMFHTKSFINGSEVLALDLKKRISKTFGCKVYDRYSNEENGFLAQADDCSNIFKVNIASFRIEILRQDSDEPVNINEVGRIVVTDLYNFAVPMIRYDTGDLAIKAEEQDGWTTSLKSIQGRKVDVIYDTKGRRLTPLTWTNQMCHFDKLKQFQFIQKDAKKYVLKLNGAKGNYEDTVFINHLKSILGSDAEIIIEHVSGIPSLASGKFKKTICEYTPQK